MPELADQVGAELQAIVASREFQRAPIISKLLTFLVGETLAGRGDQLKSYSVAVDGLGRSPDFDPQIDSYPRVQVARLRKMLDAHYAEYPPVGRVRFSIPSGSYRVYFDEAVPSSRPTFGKHKVGGISAAPSYSRWLATILLAIAVVVIGFFAIIGRLPIGSDGWRDRNFPLLELKPVVALDGAPEQKQAAMAFTNSLSEELSNYQALIVSQADGRAFDYRIEGTLRSVDSGTEVSMSLIEPANERVVWRQTTVWSPAGKNTFDFNAAAASTIATLAQPSGVIHSDKRAAGVPVNTPYGCFLAFAAKWNNRAAGHAENVRNCVQNWREGDPSSAMAHAMTSWLTVQDAIPLVGQARRAKLAEADREARLALESDALDPLSQYAVMHVALFRGNVAQMQTAANRIMALNPNNPDFAAMVGLHRIMAGDLSGEGLLQSALQRHVNPPSWLHAGMFFAAVARDDPAAALRAARLFQTDDFSVLQLGFLAMAKARSGDVAEAHRIWQQAVAIQPQLAQRPALILAPWPVAPAIRARCLEWLALLDADGGS